MQKYYKFQKPQINNNSKNIHYYQIQMNRIGSGRKNIPNRVLSPIKRNIINIS